MRIVFSEKANDDLMHYVKVAAFDKPHAARRWAKDIRKSVSKLSDFPKLGRVVPEYGDEAIREIIKGLYRIIYKIDVENKTIVILTIHHGKRLNF